jgi:hypothetical protein
MNTKLIRTLIAAAIASTAALGAQAADWQSEGKDLGQVALYVDAGSIQKMAGGVVRITAMEDFGKTEYLGEPVYPHRSRTTTFQVDCGSRQVGYESWTLHEGARGNGAVVWSDKADDGIAMFRPDAGSAHGKVLERACGGPVVAQR